MWFQGPYPAGRFSDIVIFGKVLRHFHEPGEQVKANNGYVGAANKIKCPDNPCNPVQWKMRGCSGQDIATRSSNMLQDMGDTQEDVPP